MIGWKVMVGYIEDDSVNPTSLSQIHFTDTNAIYPMLELKKVPEVADFNVVQYSDSGDLNKVIQSAIEYLGDDYYVMYDIPLASVQSYSISSRESYFSLLKGIYPSSFLSCPKFFEYYKTTSEFNNNNGFKRACIYFPTKGKLYIYNKAFTVINDTIRYDGLFQYAFTSWYIYFSSMQFLTLRQKYDESLNLKNIENYVLVTGEVENFKPSSLSYSARFRVNVSSFSKSAFTAFLNHFFSDSQVPDFDYNPGIEPDNPFEPIGPSQPGDLPPGTFDEDSDLIPDSSLPTLSASDTGFTRIYIPTLSQVQDLARYLWTDDTVIETIWNKIKQFFENPMEAIIGFNLVPVQVPSSGTKSFALMYIDTGVEMDTAANQFVDQDCGTLEVKPYYGSALDYSPYTKISCFLPYIGMVQLNTDEIMNSILQVKYRIDIVSGSCVAKILVNGNVLYQYSGHCAITIPIAASDFSSYVSAAINVAKLAVGAATGGAAGAIAAAANVDVSQQTGYVYQAEVSPQMGAIVPYGYSSGIGSQQEPEETSNTKASFSGLSPKNISNTVGEIMSAKPHVQHSGSFSGNSGYLGVRRPFLIIERPNLCMPENYQQLNGFPAMITMPLGECSGFTKVQQVQLTGMSATNPEQAEILELLKGGVIF